MAKKTAAPPKAPRLCELCGRGKGFGAKHDGPHGKCECLVKTVSVVLIKPLDGSWEDVGRRLFDLRGCSHRLLNAGVRACVRADESPMVNRAPDKDLASAARAGVKQALADERAYWTDRIGKGHEDGAIDPGKAERLAELALPSVIEDQIATRAQKAYADARKHMGRGDKSLPSFKGGAPIFLRDGDHAWNIERDTKGYVLAIKLYPGRGPMTRFAIRVDGASAHADVKRMVSEGEVKLGDARVVRNDRTGKWEARLCFQFQRPPAAEGTEVLAVHRGMHNFLTIVKTTGEVWQLPGDGYLVQKRNFSARRAQLSAHIRKGELGHGARGHGVRRRYKALNKLDDAEARMIKSACQKAASYTEHPGEKRGQRQGIGVVDCAMREPRASVVLIEDYSKLPPDDACFMPSWPYAQLKSAVAWACQKAGLELREVPASFISQRCPACAWTDPSNVKASSTRTGGTVIMFECTAPECGFRRNADAVAGFNMLAVGGCGEEPLKRFEEKLQALARASRRNEKEAAQ